MTDEQIKQNAEEYADKKAETVANFQRNPVVEDFIAGAHSRDEEIEEFQTELESLRKGFYERGDKLKELIKKLMLANNKLRNDNKDLEQALACAEDVVDFQRKELDQLRNPWISVEDRLPEKSNEDKNYSVNCIVRYKDEYLFPGEVFYTEAYYDYSYEKKSPYNKGGWVATYNNEEHFFFSDYEEHGCVVTHWMPITELKKGE